MNWFVLVLISTAIIYNNVLAHEIADVPPTIDNNKTISVNVGTRFPSEMYVITDRGIKYIRDLILGDYILVDMSRINEPYNIPYFAPFFGWLHRAHAVSTTFVDIITPIGSIILSPDHFLYASEKCNGYFTPVKASNIKIGWCLQNHYGDGIVLNITYIDLDGYYTPRITEDRITL